MYTPLFLNVTGPETSPVELWPFLLEKAFANYYSSYENLCYGNAIDFISQLTGVAYKELQLSGKKVSKETMEKSLTVIGNFLSNEAIMGIGWSEDKGIFYPITILK